MQPITNTPQFSADGTRRSVMTLDPFAMVLNSFAMGDVIAAAPVVKYMIDNFYTTPDSYRVVAKQAFRPFFPFVPDSNFHDYDDKVARNWNIPDNFSIGAVNKKKDSRLVRNTPKSIHLSQYASLTFADRLIPLDQLNYVPINYVDVSHFGVDFTKAVILITSYRDLTRSWKPQEILKVAEWVKSVGLIPVFVGKTDMDLQLEKTSLIPKTSLPDDVSEYGVDLRNKTSIVELTSIMNLSQAVCGIDSGPIHMAGTTSVPIICGYTSVAAEYRVPTRVNGKTYTITPNIECIGCESRWRSNFWNYENCYLQHIDCINHFTADKYINILKTFVDITQ